MNTQFLLMAQYGGQAIIPLERVCADYFSHLTPEIFKRRVAAGDIDLPLVQIDASRKSARGVHVRDLAAYIDLQHSVALSDHNKLHGRKSA